MEKIDTESLKYFWPMRHYLISCGTAERSNIIAVSFCMPVSKEPPMVACAVGTRAYSCELIRESGEFIINAPTQDLTRQIYYCGYHSGRDVDKFTETGLTPLPARHVNVPIIGECVAHMECRIADIIGTGDKILFVGLVVAAYADTDVERGIRKVDFASGEFPHKVYGGRFEDRQRHQPAAVT